MAYFLGYSPTKLLHYHCIQKSTSPAVAAPHSNLRSGTQTWSGRGGTQVPCHMLSQKLQCVCGSLRNHSLILRHHKKLVS
jgi:hypothetical protein